MMGSREARLGDRGLPTRVISEQAWRAWVPGRRALIELGSASRVEKGLAVFAGDRVGGGEQGLAEWAFCVGA